MAPPTVITRVKEMQADSRLARARAENIALVPTMGALHEGHIALVTEAGRLAERVVVSIFVNPAQFGQGEDFDAYPRDLSGDLEKLAGAGVSVVFAPDASEMYPAGFQTYVEVGEVTRDLESAFRPAHFRGVATVVSKLLHIVAPHIALFGEKDYQQLLVVRQLVRDLAIDADIVSVPTARDSDGLALSSRNAYLTPSERARATSLSRALFRAEAMVRRGERRKEVLIGEVRRVLEEASAAIDYVEIRDAATLATVGDEIRSNVVCLIAARVGRTRLIDNRVFRA
jgi:pantoate--beta-alanine ligase